MIISKFDCVITVGFADVKASTTLTSLKVKQRLRFYRKATYDSHKGNFSIYKDD